MEIGVVIPCRNEGKYIEECIRAIYNSELPENVKLKVFVVDGMSEDDTRQVISKMTKEFPDLYCVDNTKKLTPYAFNLGIQASGSVDYVQIVGARHIISEDYLRVCLETLQSNADLWCVGGRIINEFINETGKTISDAMSTPFGMGLGNFRTLKESCLTDTVTSPMYPSWVFNKIGLFDENLVRNQDDDFNFRITNAGGKIWYEHKIYLKYYVRGSFTGLWRQFYQYGYWKVFVNKKHGTVTTIRQLVPPLFVVYLISLLVSLFIGMSLFFIYSIPLIIYLLLLSAVSFKKAGKNHNTLDLMKTFPILHVSYGLGYLYGILEFFIFNKKPSEKQKRLSR